MVCDVNSQMLLCNKKLILNGNIKAFWWTNRFKHNCIPITFKNAISMIRNILIQFNSNFIKKKFFSHYKDYWLTKI